MTKKRTLHCSNPNCPHEKLKKFNDWVREKLPDSSTGFHVTDLDFIFSNYKTKKILLLETKTNNKKIDDWQKKIFKRINNWLGKGNEYEWEYLGFHTIICENTGFENGKVYLDKKEITEEDLIKILSF